VYKVRDWLYIGKYRETLSLAYLKAHNIGAMLQLAEPVKQEGIASLYLQVEDGMLLASNTLQDGITFVRVQKEKGNVVMVACGAGISRSSTFAIAALKEEENLDLATAYQEVLSHHPDALPHPQLWQSLCEYYSETLDYNQLWLQARRSLGTGHYLG
jgi:protein-tyrosine phosphatase